MKLFTAVEMNLSDRCNLGCAFCYTKGGGGNGPDFDRTLRTLNWILDQPGWNEQRQPRRLGVSFYGGEPLVEWDDLVRLVGALPEIGKAHVTEIKAGIVTNMTLLDSPKLDWLLARNVSVSPSIDGCPKAQDTFRKFKEGGGSSAKVAEAAKLLLKLRPNQSVRATVAPETVQYMSESVRFLWELGFKQINPVLAGGMRWPEALFDTLRGEVVKVTDWWLAQVRQGQWPSIFYLRNVATVIQSRRPSSICAAGENRIAVDTEGWVSPCHRFANPSTAAEWRLGNINTDSYESILGHPLRQAIQDFRRSYRPGRFPNCLNCGMRSYCYHWCFHEAMTDGRATFTNGALAIVPDEFHCRVWDLYYHETLRALKILAAEGNQKARDILDGKTVVPQRPCNCPNCTAKRRVTCSGGDREGR
jgi:uncharacterized protein